MTMAFLATRFLRQLSRKYSTTPLKKVLRKIANPLPMGELLHKKEGKANAPRY